MNKYFRLSEKRVGMCVKVGFVEEDGWMHFDVKQINVSQRHTYQGPVSGLHSQMTEWKMLLNQWLTCSYPVGNQTKRPVFIHWIVALYALCQLTCWHFDGKVKVAAPCRTACLWLSLSFRRANLKKKKKKKSTSRVCPPWSWNTMRLRGGESKSSNMSTSCSSASCRRGDTGGVMEHIEPLILVI